MKIHFYPERNNEMFERAAKEYSLIWKKEGRKIIATIEEISGLHFKEKIINALTYGSFSYSNPLQLQSDIPLDQKRRAIVHELCHRLIVGNNILPTTIDKSRDRILEIHKQVDLILYDILVSLYGERFAKKAVAFEINLWKGEGVSPYKHAWEWATAMTKHERQERFKTYLRKV